MQKTKNPAKSARTTLSSVKREMLEPRLTESVRNALENEPAHIVEDSSAGSRKVVRSGHANFKETLVEVSGASDSQLMVHLDTVDVPSKHTFD